MISLIPRIGSARVGAPMEHEKRLRVSDLPTNCG